MPTRRVGRGRPGAMRRGREDAAAPRARFCQDKNNSFRIGRGRPDPLRVRLCHKAYKTMPTFRVERPRPRGHPSRAMPTFRVGRGRPGALRRGREDAAAPRARFFQNNAIAFRIGRGRPGCFLGSPDMDFFRRHPAHIPPVSKHNRPTILHVTVATIENRQILCNPAVHEALQYAWREASFWLVGSYVVMPEHVHFFCSPSCPYPSPLRHWCGFWKRLAGERCEILKSAWIPDCWDTQIRTSDHFLRKTEYLRNNPVRRGLAKSWDEWPYQGALNHFVWLSE